MDIFPAVQPDRRPALSQSDIAAAVSSGDVIVTGPGGRRLAILHASGEVSGDKLAALETVRCSSLEPELRVCLMVALQQALLLDEALAQRAAPRPQPFYEMEAMRRAGRHLSLRRSLEAAPSYVVLRGMPRPICRTPDLMGALRFARQAAQAYPGDTLTVAQVVERTQLVVSPSPMEAAA